MTEDSALRAQEPSVPGAATADSAGQTVTVPKEPTDLVAVPRWVFQDFLDNQPGWPDTARRYLNAPALLAAPASVGEVAELREALLEAADDLDLAAARLRREGRSRFEEEAKTGATNARNQALSTRNAGAGALARPNPTKEGEG